MSVYGRDVDMDGRECAQFSREREVRMVLKEARLISCLFNIEKAVSLEWYRLSMFYLL